MFIQQELQKALGNEGHCLRVKEYAEMMSWEVYPLLPENVAKPITNVSISEECSQLLLAACLEKSSVILVKRIQSDVMAYMKTGNQSLPNSLFEKDMVILGELPRSFRPRYSEEFALNFLLAAGKMTLQLARGDEATQSLAEQLAFHLLCTLLPQTAHSLGIVLADNCEIDLQDYLLPDVDYQFLYEPGKEMFALTEAGRAMGMVSSAFDDWFLPFTGEKTIPAFVD